MRICDVALFIWCVNAAHAFKTRHSITHNNTRSSAACRTLTRSSFERYKVVSLVVIEFKVLRTVVALASLTPHSFDDDDDDNAT